MMPAIKESAAAFELIQNHPSGDPTPSQQDLEITHRLSKTGKIIGINMVDHIIIGVTFSSALQMKDFYKNTLNL